MMMIDDVHVYVIATKGKELYPLIYKKKVFEWAIQITLLDSCHVKTSS